MYKCLECGHLFEEGEQATWEESRGEFWGTSCSEEMNGCPICKGDYEETKRCEICGGEFLKDELNGGLVCDDCLEEKKRDLETCYKVSSDENEEITINALLVSLFDVSEIEKILYQQLLTVKNNIDCSAFINQDKDWFAEKLVEVLKDEK